MPQGGVEGVHQCGVNRSRKVHCSAAFVMTMAKRRQSELAVQAFFHHYSISLTRLGGGLCDAALFMPLDLANRRSIASPKSALHLPIAPLKRGGAVSLRGKDRES